MPEDKWAKYAEKPADKWAQYATPIIAPAPKQERGVLGKIWDWANEGIVSKDTFVRAMTGMAPEQLDDALKSYPEESRVHAAIREFTRGSLQDAGATASSLTSTQALPLIGGLAGSAAGPAGMVVGSGIGRLGQQMINARYGSGKVPETAVGAAADVGGEMAVSALSVGGAKLAEKLAPKLAEAALGTRFSERMYGRNPGATILRDTKGFTPEAIASSSKNVSRQIVSQLENAAQRAGNSGVTTSTRPALNILNQAISKATAENNAAEVAALRGARQQLTNRLNPVTGAFDGAPIPRDISPIELLDLKRGLGDTITNWGKIPERQGASGILKQGYHALDAEFDRAVPGAAENNQIVSTLIGITRDAERRRLSPGIMQNVASKMLARTGALTAGAVGGVEGYRQGGPWGGLVGGLAGLVVPEVLARPSTVMLGARGLSSFGRTGAVPLSTLLTGLYSSRD